MLKVASETWSGLRAGGGSRDGIRTVEAGYRAVARQTVTSCRAQRVIWDDTGSTGLKFAVNECLNFILYKSCLFLHVRELGNPTGGVELFKNNPSDSYGASPAIWNHTVLAAT